MQKFQVVIKIHGEKLISEYINSENIDTAHGDCVALMQYWHKARPEIVAIRRVDSL